MLPRGNEAPCVVTVFPHAFVAFVSTAGPPRIPLHPNTFGLLSSFAISIYGLACGFPRK